MFRLWPTSWGRLSTWLLRPTRDADKADKSTMTAADQSAEELEVLLEQLQVKMAKLEGNLMGQVLRKCACPVHVPRWLLAA